METLNDMERKQLLIKDVQDLLNSYDNVNSTFVDPALLEFMDEETLVNIIDGLLNQKEAEKEADLEWLEKFKKAK